MDSIWSQEIELPKFKLLQFDLKTGVLIIGGGMAGLLCAWQLARAGADYALVEADRICGGITKNTTAKITVQHGLVFDKLIRKFGLDKARIYLEANRAALEQYRTLCAGIDCDFEERDSYVYSLRGRERLEREAEAMSRLGQEARLVTEIPLPFEVDGAVGLPRQAQFHPLKFAAALAKGLHIYEHTKVLELGPGKAVTNGGTVSAENIIVATHFPLLNKHGGYFMKLYQSRSYVLALENAPQVGGMFVDENEKGMSFRDCGDILLLGGGSHRTGKKGGAWQELEAFAKTHYPQAKPVTRWATQDCMTLDSVPYVGQYSRGTKGLYVATGFNKWGMTSSMAAATLLADLVLGRENRFTSVFSPSRSILRPQLAVNIWESAAGLLTPTCPRCPHMGCALKYNAAEHSWDCPCHGSRFGEDGMLINNPATDDMKRA